MTAATVDEYIAGAPAGARAALETVRAAIREVVPDASEVISYQIPTVKLTKALVSYAAWKNHIGVYALSATLLRTLADDVKPYATAKGTLQFPLSEPMPVALIQKLVRAKLAEHEAELAAKAATKAEKSK